MPFESGIKRYIKARAVVEVNFPVDDRDNEYIRCEFCPFYSPTARRCRLTEEVVPFPNKYVGGECPLELQESEELT